MEEPKQGGVVIVRNEAGLLAVRFPRHRQLPNARQFPHLILMLFSQRKEGVGELLLGKPVERVRLVFLLVHASPELPRGGYFVPCEARVVSRRDPFGAERTRAVGQRPELNQL